MIVHSFRIDAFIFVLCRFLAHLFIRVAFVARCSMCCWPLLFPQSWVSDSQCGISYTSNRIRFYGLCWPDSNFSHRATWIFSSFYAVELLPCQIELQKYFHIFTCFFWYLVRTRTANRRLTCFGYDAFSVSSCVVNICRHPNWIRYTAIIGFECIVTNCILFLRLMLCGVFFWGSHQKLWRAHTKNPHQLHYMEPITRLTEIDLVEWAREQFLSSFICSQS